MSATSNTIAKLLVLVSLLLPCSSGAEGNRRYFDCEMRQQCDADGQCTAATGVVNFELEPLAVGSDGAGRYALQYDDTNTEMDALSEAGPFRWSIGAEHHTLLASSETRMLWHQLDLAGIPTARIIFLSCAFRY